MPRPIPTRIFHITAIDNLAEICKRGQIACKAALAASGARHESIAYESIQHRRKKKIVTAAPGGVLHDYVPFYFAPRSPMLDTVNRGNVKSCSMRQADILHFETTVERVASGGHKFVIYPISAALDYSTQCFNTLSGLDSIDWPLFFEPPLVGDYSKYYFSRLEPARHAQRMETRQAEFLVHQSLPLLTVKEIGVATATEVNQVTAILKAYNVTLPVMARADWYFLGQ
jgi:hypothetical protein